MECGEPHAYAGGYVASEITPCGIHEIVGHSSAYVGYEQRPAGDMAHSAHGSRETVGTECLRSGVAHLQGHRSGVVEYQHMPGKCVQRLNIGFAEVLDNRTIDCRNVVVAFRNNGTGKFAGTQAVGIDGAGDQLIASVPYCYFQGRIATVDSQSNVHSWRKNTK